MNINNYSFGQNQEVLARKSIIAYVVPMGAWFVIWATSLAISPLAAAVVFLIGVYIAMYLRSYTLFIDDEGVWVFVGVFPWNRGIYGVKWGDFSEGVFFPNLDSWVFRSFTIEIKNRYKNEPEIMLTNMHNGDNAIVKINSVFLQKYRRRHQ